MITELRTEIDRLLSSVPGLSDSQVFMGKATQTTSAKTSDLCVWNLITNPMFRDSGTEFDENFIQIIVAGKNHNTIEQIEQGVKDRLKIENFDLTQHHITLCKREFSNHDLIEDLWQILMQFKIVLHSKN